MTEFITTHAQLLLFLAGAVLIVFLAKRIGDRRLSRTLAAGLAEIEADRQGRIAAGFAAGWHGATR